MATTVRSLAQDAAYITVGLGVLAFQKAQVARREARARVETQVKDATTRLRTGIDEARGVVRTRAQEARSRVEPLAGQVQERLPDPLAKLVGSALRS
jgi:hypothetical protein